MGLIRAIVSATQSVMTEQWKEFFTCEGLGADILMVRGTKVCGANSTNTKSDDNVISDGSVIAVAEGQNAIVVSGGKVIDLFKEPGEHVLHGGSPSLLGGAGAKSVGKEILKRASFGGDVVATTQRVYYVNCKEIPNNQFAVRVPFAIKDDNIGLDMDATLVATGVYSFRICDAEIIYKNLMGNVEGNYRTSTFTKQLESEIYGCFMKAVSEFSTKGLRPAEIEALPSQMSLTMPELISTTLRQKRGIEIVSLGFNTFWIDDLDAISIMQGNKVLTNPAMAAATLSSATASALEEAAKNTNGFGSK